MSRSAVDLRQTPPYMLIGLGRSSPRSPRIRAGRARRRASRTRSPAPPLTPLAAPQHRYERSVQVPANVPRSVCQSARLLCASFGSLSPSVGLNSLLGAWITPNLNAPSASESTSSSSRWAPDARQRRRLPPASRSSFEADRAAGRRRARRRAALAPPRGVGAASRTCSRASRVVEPTTLAGIVRSRSKRLRDGDGDRHDRSSRRRTAPHRAAKCARSRRADGGNSLRCRVSLTAPAHRFSLARSAYGARPFPPSRPPARPLPRSARARAPAPSARLDHVVDALLLVLAVLLELAQLRRRRCSFARSGRRRGRRGRTRPPSNSRRCRGPRRQRWADGGLERGPRRGSSRGRRSATPTPRDEGATPPASPPRRARWSKSADGARDDSCPRVRTPRSSARDEAKSPTKRTTPSTCARRRRRAAPAPRVTSARCPAPPPPSPRSHARRLRRSPEEPVQRSLRVPFLASEVLNVNTPSRATSAGGGDGDFRRRAARSPPVSLARSGSLLIRGAGGDGEGAFGSRAFGAFERAPARRAPVPRVGARSRARQRPRRRSGAERAAGDDCRRERPRGRRTSRGRRTDQRADRVARVEVARRRQRRRERARRAAATRRRRARRTEAPRRRRSPCRSRRKGSRRRLRARHASRRARHRARPAASAPGGEPSDPHA